MKKYKLGSAIWVQDAGEWFYIYNKPSGFQPTMDEETLIMLGAKPLNRVDESEECEYGSSKYCDNPCCVECALDRKKCRESKPKLEKLKLPMDMTEIKINEIIDYLNSSNKS